ncbi:MAG: arylesterase [Steroidobacterales bacterium]
MKRIVVVFVMTLMAVSAFADTGTILVFGDSISAGFGLSPPERSWVNLLQSKLHSEGYGYRVINASVSGETTAGGLARLPRALSLHHPAIVVLELGGNDGLRALPVAAMRANLAQMALLARAGGAEVLLLGMRIPPNYGPAYTEQFFSAFGLVALELHLRCVPFLLQDVALSAGLMQADGFHPNELGQPRLLDNVWPALKPMLRK